MSLTSNIRSVFSSNRSLRNEASVSSLNALGGSFQLGGVADPETARKLSAVDACIEILSNSIAKLPNYAMMTDTRERVAHYLLQLLNNRPNEAMTPFIRKKIIETSRLETGNGYDWILRDPRSGKVVELVPIPGNLVTPWRDRFGRVWYTVLHPLSGEPMILDNQDVCHYKGATRDGLSGISVLRRAAEVVGAAKAAQEYDRTYYENGGQPSGVLETAADIGGYAKDSSGAVLRDSNGNAVTKKELLRREWERVHAGPKNGHRIAILDLGLKYTPMSAASNRDAQFIENKEMSVRDIARFFGVPLYKLQEGKQSYSSNEQNAIEYVVSTLHPTVTQYEEEQTYKLLTDSELRTGLQLKINMMAELKGDTTSRGAWYKNMRDNGVFSVNDIRALEDLPDVEGGDERLASLNYVPLSDWKQLSENRNRGESK